MRKRFNPRTYYENYIPDTLFRPLKDRPANIKGWSYLEKIRYYDTMNKHRETLEYVKANGELPPDKTAEDEKYLKSQKLITRKNDGLHLHRNIENTI